MAIDIARLPCHISVYMSDYWFIAERLRESLFADDNALILLGHHLVPAVSRNTSFFLSRRFLLSDYPPRHFAADAGRLRERRQAFSLDANSNDKAKSLY